MSFNLPNDKVIRNILYLCVFIGMTVVLTSCATSNHAKLPASWEGGELPSSQDCVDISGTYRNLGEDAPSNKDKSLHRRHPQYLSEFFIPSLLVNGRKHRWITHIKITGANQGTLRIDFKKQDNIIDTIELKRKEDFSCTQQGIEIKETTSMHYDIASLGDVRKNTLIFNKNHDGDLLVKEKQNEKGIALILIVPMPYIESSTQWYRFPAIGKLP